MGIDWFTVAAQAVNFLLLLWLLQRFLYGPITRAMAERRARIAAAVEEAAETRRAAQREAAEYRERLADLDRRRDALLDQADEEAAARREQLIAEARADVERTEAHWRDALRREQDWFRHTLRRRTAEEVVALARAALGDLADTALEAATIRVFLRRMDALDDAEASAMAGAFGAQDGGAVVVRSAFELGDDDRCAITAALRRRVPTLPALRFETDPALGLGMELRTAGWKLAWTLDEYLDAMESRLVETLRHGEAAGANARGGP